MRKKKVNKLIKNLIITNAFVFSILTSMEQTPLIQERSLFNAAQKNDFAKVWQILQNTHGFNINWQNRPSGNTALHWAAINQNIALAEKLLINGANPDIQNKVGLTPMHFAL